MIMLHKALDSAQTVINKMQMKFNIQNKSRLLCICPSTETAMYYGMNFMLAL